MPDKSPTLASEPLSPINPTPMLTRTAYPPLAAAIEASGMSYGTYARKVLYRSPSTVYRWLTGRSPVPKEVRDFLTGGTNA